MELEGILRKFNGIVMCALEELTQTDTYTWLSSSLFPSCFRVNRLLLADKDLAVNSVEDTIEGLAMRHMQSLKSVDDRSVSALYWYNPCITFQEIKLKNNLESHYLTHIFTNRNKFRMAMDMMDLAGLKEVIRSSMIKHFNTEGKQENFSLFYQAVILTSSCSYSSSIAELEYMVDTYATPIGQRVSSLRHTTSHSFLFKR